MNNSDGEDEIKWGLEGKLVEVGLHNPRIEEVGGELVCSLYTVTEVKADDSVCSQTSCSGSESPHATASIEYDLILEACGLKWHHPVQELVFIGSPIGVQLIKLLPLPAKGLARPFLL